MPAEVACLDITPLCGEQHSTICAVGLWNISALLIDIKNMSVLHKEELGGGKRCGYGLAHKTLPTLIVLMLGAGYKTNVAIYNSAILTVRR